MHGNVAEWCQDWYGEYPQEDVTNPVGPSEGSHRVNRGGSWAGDAGICLSAYRFRSEPGGWFNDVGFRLARAIR
jgi:formylglycine-generating enzyme required for sulfatase activity